MLLDCRWFLRSPRASDTIANLPRDWSWQPPPAVFWPTRPTTRKTYVALWQHKDVLRLFPANASRSQKLPYERELYKARSDIECTFGLLKQARRFATRYEKTLRNYAAVVAIGCALLWLRI